MGQAIWGAERIKILLLLSVYVIHWPNLSGLIVLSPAESVKLADIVHISKHSRLQSRATWVPITCVSLMSCVISGKVHNLSVRRFPHIIYYYLSLHDGEKSKCTVWNKQSAQCHKISYATFSATIIHLPDDSFARAIPDSTVTFKTWNLSRWNHSVRHTKVKDVCLMSNMLS